MSVDGASDGGGQSVVLGLGGREASANKRGASRAAGQRRVAVRRARAMWGQPGIFLDPFFQGTFIWFGAPVWVGGSLAPPHATRHSTNFQTTHALLPHLRTLLRNRVVRGPGSDVRSSTAAPWCNSSWGTVSEELCIIAAVATILQPMWPLLLLQPQPEVKGASAAQHACCSSSHNACNGPAALLKPRSCSCDEVARAKSNARSR